MAIPTSSAACNSWARAPYTLGAPKIGVNATTRSAGTRTPSRVTVPEAVVRCPIPSQSSTTCNPAVPAGTKASAFGVDDVGVSPGRPGTDARTITQSANRAPVQ